MEEGSLVGGQEIENSFKQCFLIFLCLPNLVAKSKVGKSPTCMELSSRTVTVFLQKL